MTTTLISPPVSLVGLPHEEGLRPWPRHSIGRAKPGGVVMRPSCTDSGASCCSCRMSRAPRKPRAAFSAQSRSRASRAPNPGSCTQRRALHACSRPRPSRRSTHDAGRNLQLVHRGLRHRRPQGRQGAAGRTGHISPFLNLYLSLPHSQRLQNGNSRANQFCNFCTPCIENCLVFSDALTDIAAVAT